MNSQEKANIDSKIIWKSILIPHWDVISNTVVKVEFYIAFL